MVSFTHLFTRTRSFQALVVRMTSRGLLAPLAHSLGISEQNSTQPIGAREFSPSDTKSGRSASAGPPSAARKPITVIARRADLPQVVPSILSEYRCIGVAPVPC